MCQCESSQCQILPAVWLAVFCVFSAMFFVGVAYSLGKREVFQRAVAAGCGEWVGDDFRWKGHD